MILLRETDEDRLERMGHHARFLKERGYLREGVMVQRGWPLPRFARFVADFMITALLSPE